CAWERWLPTSHFAYW
nr:immunoglobulin heavy chain junction region [Mus musculus]MBK4187498.1 immunoglobulin heavy chain junction region [Mus musculus]MBK4187499.1 immunoglobulin heavy chain junction region [Mus musculus]MBK4187500.1 immunoglobulin heavy chain junction region [Mus musculus]MBK4187501.1 immunoglobulin heavy chain junction region [Mus musculus]